MDAVLPGRIVGGGHHPPAFAARGVGPHHDGPPFKFRVVPLFHGGKKGIHVQVADEAHDFHFNHWTDRGKGAAKTRSRHETFRRSGKITTNCHKNLYIRIMG